MEAYFSAVVASAVVVAGVTCFLGAVLLMRNPHNPAWVMNETFAQAASLLMTFAIASAMAVALNGYLAAGFNVITAFAATGVLVALTSIETCRSGPLDAGTSRPRLPAHRRQRRLSLWSHDPLPKNPMRCRSTSSGASSAR
jgi:hypothetical protein